MRVLTVGLALVALFQIAEPVDSSAEPHGLDEPAHFNPSPADVGRWPASLDELMSPRVPVAPREVKRPKWSPSKAMLVVSGFDHFANRPASCVTLAIYTPPIRTERWGWLRLVTEGDLVGCWSAGYETGIWSTQPTQLVIGDLVPGVYVYRGAAKYGDGFWFDVIDSLTLRAGVADTLVLHE